MKLSDFDTVTKLQRDRHVVLRKIDKLDKIQVLIDGEFQTTELAKAVRPAISEALCDEVQAIERELVRLGVEL